MIYVDIIKAMDDDRIISVTVEGHANYSEPGSDIVCSAISALTIGAVNSVEILLHIDLKPELGEQEDGYLAWSVPKLDDHYTDEKLQLLMKSMQESILMIEKEYNKYIRVNIEAM